MAKKALKCSKLFDSATGTVMENMIVLVDGNKITDLLPADKAGPLEDYEIIDLTGKFVTPGLIDCHVHLCSNGESGNPMEYLQTPADMTLYALRNCQDDLKAGFTTLRTAGDNEFIAEAVRDAVNRGEFWGPRMMTPGSAISTTGGHADSHYAPHVDEHFSDHSVGDGAAELAKAVRYNIKHGASCIKFMATGGVMSRGTTVGAQQMTYDEMRAVIETAELYGLITAAHAHGTDGIKTAARAGVTSIEHGMMMDEECIQIMKEKGTYLVPTCIAAERIIVKGPEIGTPDWMIAKAKQVYERHQWGFTRCMEEGIPIAFGTDSATPFNFHGKQTYEFQLLTEFGMTPAQALQTATKTASELLRMNTQIGSIEAGKFADIVAFDGDPMADITAMNNCCFVMKDGAVYRN